jgi:hypothetical protein
MHLLKEAVLQKHKKPEVPALEANIRQPYSSPSDSTVSITVMHGAMKKGVSESSDTPFIRNYYVTKIILCPTIPDHSR